MGKEETKTIRVNKETHSKAGMLKFQREYRTLGDVVDKAIDLLYEKELDVDNLENGKIEQKNGDSDYNDELRKEDFETEQEYYAEKKKREMRES